MTGEPRSERVARVPAHGDAAYDDEQGQRRAYLATLLAVFLSMVAILVSSETRDLAIMVVRVVVATSSAVLGVLLWTRVISVHAAGRALIAISFTALTALIVRWRFSYEIGNQTLYWLAAGFVLSVLVYGRRVGLRLSLGLYGLLLATALSLLWASDPPSVSHLVNLLGLLAMVIALLHALGGRYEALLAARSLAASHELEANTDPLTGVANRRRLHAELVAAVDRPRATERPLSVVSFDLDHFKGVNDRFGHDAGDAVLVEVVARVRGVTRSRDLLGRWGGEEFLLLLDDCDEATATTIAEACRRAISAEPVHDVGTVTASFGVATLADGEDLDDLLRRLDRRLYAAKSAGRDRVVAAAEAAGDDDGHQPTSA